MKAILWVMTVMLFAMALILYKASQPAPLPPTPSPIPSTIVLSSDLILQKVNDYRSSYGLSTLAKNDRLCALAKERVDYLSKDNYKAFNESKIGDHKGLVSQVFGDKYRAWVGENLVSNILSEQDAVNKWKISPAHNQLLQTARGEGFPVRLGCVATKSEPGQNLVVLLISSYEVNE